MPGKSMSGSKSIIRTSEARRPVRAWISQARIIAGCPEPANSIHSPSRVTLIVLITGKAEQFHVGEHVRQVGVVDVVAFIGLAQHAFAGQVLGPVEASVCVGQRGPTVITQGCGGLEPVVAHHSVEAGDRVLRAADRVRVEAAAAR